MELSTFHFLISDCDCIFSFQEIWNSPYSNDCFPVYAEDIDAGGDASPSTTMLSEVSRLLKITIVGGSIPERSGNSVYNTCCVFGTDGKLKAKHRKVLFETCLIWCRLITEYANLVVQSTDLRCQLGLWSGKAGSTH